MEIQDSSLPLNEIYCGLSVCSVMYFYLSDCVGLSYQWSVAYKYVCVVFDAMLLLLLNFCDENSPFWFSLLIDSTPGAVHETLHSLVDIKANIHCAIGAGRNYQLWI